MPGRGSGHIIDAGYGSTILTQFTQPVHRAKGGRPRMAIKTEGVTRAAEARRKEQAQYWVFLDGEFKRSEEIGVRLHNLKDSFAVYVTPFGNYVDIERGIRCMVSSWRRIDDNAAPARAKITGIYVNSALAKTEAMENGFDEAIMLTHEGHVCEGSAEN